MSYTGDNGIFKIVAGDKVGIPVYHIVFKSPEVRFIPYAFPEIIREIVIPGKPDFCCITNIKPRKDLVMRCTDKSEIRLIETEILLQSKPNW